MLTNIYFAHICKVNSVYFTTIVTGYSNRGSDRIDSIFTPIKELYKSSSALGALTTHYYKYS